MTDRVELAALPLVDRIRAVMAGMGQEEFAGRLGVTTATVNRWLNHHTKPDYPSRVSLAGLASDVLGAQVSPDVFREHVTLDHQQVFEAGAAQLTATARAIEQAGDRLAVVAELVVPLLEQQVEVVAEMQRVLADLRRLRDATADAGELR